MSTLTKDISTITTIPESAIINLTDVAINCISYEASTLLNQDIAVIDIGIGELRVKRDGDELQYKFIPSNKLDSSIRSSINGDVKLIRQCEDALVGRILNTYKNLL